MNTSMKGRRGRAALIATVVLAASATAAAPVTAAENERVPPAVQDSSGEFYTESQIDEVWAQVTAAWPEPLPGDVKFPVDAPGFFHPEGEARAVFQSQLPDLVAARIWRCAWIAEGLAASGAASDLRAGLAQERLERYQGLPGVKSTVDVAAYEVQIAEYAQRSEQDVWAAEYEIECTDFDSSVNPTGDAAAALTDAPAGLADDQFAPTDTVTISGLQALTEVRYWDSPRTNTFAQSYVAIQQTGNTSGGCLDVALRRTSAPTGTFARGSSCGPWATVYNDNGNAYQPAGTFYLSTGISNGGCGGPGCGAISWAANLQFNVRW
jgi:hypothetical protein